MTFRAGLKNLARRKSDQRSLSASKKSLLFSLPSLMPLSVLPLAVWTLMSNTPVVTSGDVNIKVASHLSNLPAMEIDDLTSDVTALEEGVTANTGACAAIEGVEDATAKRNNGKARTLLFIVC